MADYLRESGVKWLWNKIKTLLSAKQDKLVSGTNIKTINGTSLLGDGDIAIEGGDSTGDVDEGRLVWSDEDSPSTLMDIAYLNGNGNKIAGIPPSLVTIEYSADNGATWRDSGISDASKTRLTNHRINGSAYIRPNGSTTLDINYQTRITIDLIEDSATNAWVGCFEFRKIILKCSGIQRNDTHTMTVEMQKYGSTTWDIIKVSRFWGSPGFFSISTPKRTVGYPSASYYRKVRLTWQTGDVYTNIANINGIFFMSDNTVGVGGGKEPSQYAITGTPYSVDYNQNVTFPNAIKGKKLITDGGKSTQVVKGDGSLEEESALAVASALDAEHAQEADYAGVADKLTTARTISLGGAARGSTTFDGSTGREIDVTALYEAYMSYGGKAIAGDVSPIDGTAVSELWCNKFAYYNPDYINVEYTNNYSEDADGNESSDVIWTEYPYTNTNTRLNKLFALVTGGNGNFYSSGSSSNGTAIAGKTRLRVTFNTYLARYIAPKKLLISVGASVKRLNNQIKVEVVSKTDYDAGNTDKFTHYSTNVVSSDGGWNSMSFASSFGNAPYAAIKKLRITFIVNEVDTTNRTPVLHNIYMIGKHHSANDDNLAASGHLYKYDYRKNMEIPAALAPMTSKTQDIGYASRPWKNVYAQKYITDGGTSEQVVLGNGSLRPISELSPITDTDAEILLDNHIHSIDVNTNGNDVNISVIESSKNGNNWETEDNDIPIPLATTTSAGVMSKEDKIKSDGLLIYYHLTEDEYNNHEIVSLYPLVLAIKDTLFDSSTNKWKYDDSKTYDVRVKGWTLQDNGITYLNVNVRLLTSQGGHSIGFSGFVDVDFITETYFDALIPLYIGYICGKYHIENDGMTVVAPEDSGFYIEI